MDPEEPDAAAADPDQAAGAEPEGGADGPVEATAGDEVDAEDALEADDEVGVDKLDEADDEGTDDDEVGVDELDEGDEDATDEDDEGARHTALPRRVERWRQKTTSGMVAGAIAMGLRQVFEVEQRQPAIVQEAPGDPYDDDDPVIVDYVADDAEGTVVTVRPWLLKGDRSSDADGEVDG